MTTTFVYDGDGGRVKKTQVSTTTVYIGQLYVCKGTACAKLIYAGAQRVAMVQVNSGSTSYFHADHLGSTSGLTNANGTAEEHNSYEPYGDLHTHTGTSDVAYKYTGQERDASTDLYFYQARYYAQGLGRFVSPDSIVQNPLDPQAFNRYAYARNNPVRYTDPTGHYWWDDLPGPGDDLGGGYTPTPGVPVLDEVRRTWDAPAARVVVLNPLWDGPLGTDLLGMDLLGMNPWIPPGSDPFVTLVGFGAGEVTSVGCAPPCRGVSAQLRYTWDPLQRPRKNNNPYYYDVVITDPRGRSIERAYKQSYNKQTGKKSQIDLVIDGSVIRNVHFGLSNPSAIVLQIHKIYGGGTFAIHFDYERQIPLPSEILGAVDWGLQ